MHWHGRAARGRFAFVEIAIDIASISGNLFGKVTNGFAVMHARSLERFLVEMGGTTAADMDLRTRGLREIDLLPVGGRGLAVPKIGAREAAIVLIALGCCTRAAHVAETVRTYMRLVDPLHSDGGPFVDVLADILSDSQQAGSIEEIRICRTHPWVKVVFPGGRVTTYHQARLKLDWKVFDPNKQLLGGGREEFIAGGALIHQLAIDLETGQEIV